MPAMSVRPWLLMTIVASACGESTLVATEVLPPGTELKVVGWSDGRTHHAQLRRADDASLIPVAEALENDRTISLFVFPVPRAALDAAIPGAGGASIEQVLALLGAEADAPLAIPDGGAVLVASLEAGASEVVYAPVARAQWDADVAAGRRPAIGLVVDDALACRVVQPIDVIGLPESFTALDVAAVDATRAFVVGATGTTAFALVEVHADGRAIRVPTPARSRPQSIDWDAATSTLWGLDTSRRPFRLSPTGDEVPFPTPPRTTFRVMSAGRDGTVAAIGSLEEDRIPTYLFDRRTQTWSTHRETVNVLIGEIRAYSRDRILADVNCQTGTWRGTAWAASGAMGNCSRPRDFTIDASQYLWIGRDGTLKVSVDELGADWPDHAHAIPPTQDNVWPRALAAMEAGRFAVAGDGGTLEVWIGDRWCVPSGDHRGLDLTAGSGVDGAAWFVGTGARSVVRVGLGP